MRTQIRMLLKEQSDLVQHCLSKRLEIFQRVDKTYNIHDMRLKGYYVSTVRILMKCMHVCAAQKTH